MNRTSTVIIGIYIYFMHHPNSDFFTSEFCGALSSIVRTDDLPIGLEFFPEKRGQKPGCFPSKVSKLVMPPTATSRLPSSKVTFCALNIARQMLTNTSDTDVKSDTF